MGFDFNSILFDKSCHVAIFVDIIVVIFMFVVILDVVVFIGQVL